MKVLSLISFVCIFVGTLAYPHDLIDWSNVKARVIDPFTGKIVVKDHTYIVGGEEAEPHSLPYQAALLIQASDGYNYFCGGSLITPNYVVTAAHCVDIAVQVTVILGAHRYRDLEPTQVRYVVPSDAIKVHAGWDVPTLRHDIAIMKLPETVSLNENIQTIAMPTYADYDDDFVGVMGKVSGWGLDSDSSTTTSNVLRFVDVQVMTNVACADVFGDYVHTSNICITGTGGKGSCSGDSGGPFVYESKQIGLVSYGAADGCELGYPSGFTRITSYLDWLVAHSDVVVN